jgi:D-threonate/D-erythronate kinase
MKIAIVTDDLTSATDGAVGFAEAGWTAKVTRGASVGTSLESADVLSIDVASRRSSLLEAVRRVTAAGAAVSHAPTLVKQFDSTLRGHVAAETLALLRASGRRQVIVAPAFPAAGRTTVDARQFVSGIPVHESIYAHDPFNPVQTSDVRALFELEGVEVGRSEVDCAPVIVLDSETESDLDAIAARCMDRNDLILAGSTGLMRALARHWAGPVLPRNAIRTPGRRVLIVVGSVNSQSREQLEVLRRATIPVFPISQDSDPELLADSIALEFDSFDAITLTTTIASADPTLIGAALSQTAARLVERAAIDAIVVTGGDTMATLLDRLGTHSLSVCYEIEPGIPLCLLTEPRYLPLISKAGGFGSPEVLLKAVSALRAPYREIAR